MERREATEETFRKLCIKRVSERDKEILEEYVESTNISRKIKIYIIWGIIFCSFFSMMGILEIESRGELKYFANTMQEKFILFLAIDLLLMVIFILFTFFVLSMDKTRKDAKIIKQALKNDAENIYSSGSSLKCINSRRSSEVKINDRCDARIYSFKVDNDPYPFEYQIYDMDVTGNELNYGGTYMFYKINENIYLTLLVKDN